MATRLPHQPVRASRLETLGAWLRLWTPPRDVEVPPVPRRAVALLAGALLVLAGLVAVVVAPVIDDAKQDRSTRDSAAVERRQAAIRTRQIAEQRPRTGRGTADPAGAPAAERLAARDALVADVQQAVTRDARARFAAGTLDRRVSATGCEPFPRVSGRPAPHADLTRNAGVYDCVAQVRAIDGGRGQLGFPFRAILRFRTGAFAFCKTNPAPGERVIPDPRRTVELPAACRAPRSG